MSGSPDLKAQQASATHGADVAAVKAEKKKAAWKKEWRMHLTAFIGETLGTAIFLFLGEGIAKTANLGRTASDTQTAAPLDSQTIMMISVGFGMSLLTTAWLFYRITGGLFNPAITLALWLCGVLTSLRACLLFVAQMIGGIIAAALVLALTPQGSAGVNVVNNTLNDVTLAQGFFLEMLGTSVLVFSVLMLAVEKHRATYLAPVGIGLTIFAVHLFLVSWTGCALSPTRAFGPAVVSGNFPREHWIYWIGPMVGGILAVVYFQILKMFNYTSCVLDQDTDKEVTGLRPVHMRVYKRLAGHKDWATDSNEKRLVLLRRRRQRRAQRKEMREANEADFSATTDGYATDTDNENGLHNITSRSTLGGAGSPGIHAVTSNSTLAANSPTIQTRDMAATA